MLGLDAVGIGDLAGGRRRYAEAARLHTRLLDYEGSAYGLSGLAGLGLAQGRPEASARLVGASEHARQIIGIARWPGMESIDDTQSAALAAALDPETFAAARADGALMPIPDALAYGLVATTLPPRPLQ